MPNTSRPLPLSGAKNVRDLGSYQTLTGAITKNYSLLRGDALHNLSEEDCQFLYAYGVRCVIDLRSVEEALREPDRFPFGWNETEYIHIPIQDHIRANRYTEEFPPSMWQLYRWLLDDSQTQFQTIFETIARYPDSGVLFHCSGGKDRTGVTAMLLLKLAGVSDETVTADYAVTEALMKDIFPLQVMQLEARGLNVPPYVMQSPPENMEKALEHLSTVYHTAEAYLHQIGLSEEQIKSIKKKIVD